VTLHLLVSIFTACAVFFLSTLVVSIFHHAFERYKEQYLAPRISDLSEMFFFVGPREVVALTVALASIAGSIGLLLMGPLATLLLVSVAFLSPTLWVGFYRGRRIKLFERQLVDALGGLSAAFRAGMSMYQAMEEVGKSSQAPLGDEFSLTVREMRLGASANDALTNLLDRVPSDELSLMVTSVKIGRSTGGNMAEIFDRLALTMRERFRIEGRIDSLTAQGRLQAWVIGSIPLLVWLAFDALRPDMTRPMMSHWFGWAAVSLVFTMEAIGIYLIRRIVAIQI
jgi:tight adherence protein B